MGEAANLGQAVFRAHRVVAAIAVDLQVALVVAQECIGHLLPTGAVVGE